MIAASPQFAAFIRSQIKTPAVMVKVQMPNPSGTATVTQFVIPDVVSCSLKRTSDASADTCGFVISDPTGRYSSINRLSAYGAAFQPGVIDNHFLVYFGFRGNLQ